MIDQALFEWLKLIYNIKSKEQCLSDYHSLSPSYNLLFQLTELLMVFMVFVFSLMWCWSTVKN